jgi:hypothetical protein
MNEAVIANTAFFQNNFFQTVAKREKQVGDPSSRRAAVISSSKDTQTPVPI